MNETNSEVSPQLRDTKILQKIFLVTVTVSYVLQVVQGVNTFGLGLSTRFSIEYIVISVLPVTFFLVSYLLQSRQPSRLLRLFLASAAAAASWCLWNAVGVFANRFFTREPFKTVEVDIYLAVAVFVGLTLTLTYLRKRRLW